MAGQFTDEKLIVPWVVFNMTGQILLFFLLFTLVVGKDIPHRRNLYLLSLVVGNLLSSILANLMVYIGDAVANKVPLGVCIVQSAMMDTFPIIIFLVLVVLALDNLAELCHLCFRTKHFTRQITAYSILVLLPYLLVAILSVWSYVEVINKDRFLVQRNEKHWVWCRTDNPGSKHMVQPTMSYIIVVLNVTIILIEFSVLGLIYLFPLKVDKDPKKWRTTSSFSIRILILFLVQLVVVILVVVNPVVSGTNENSPVKLTFEMLQSLQPLAVFLVFATQRAIFLKWAEWAALLWAKIRRKPEEDPYAPQPFGLPGHSFPDYGRERYPWETSGWDEESVSFPEKSQEKGFRRFLKVPSFNVPRLPRWQPRKTASSGG